MLNPKDLFDSLKLRDVGLFTGVPDSLLSNFCAYVDDHTTNQEHIIAANEGNAVALATGYHLATGKVSVVYMQNSGLGNTINPLTSIADTEVYGIPMLLIIGWRGEPNVHDEPQHIKQGRITCKQLDVLEIPYQIVDEHSVIEVILDDAFQKIRETNAPVALVVKKNVFSEYKSQSQQAPIYSLIRETALEHVLSLMDENALVISTTGKTSRELFELREKHGESQRDFLTVGGMGHTASIALGVALGQSNKQVICFDGDGSLLMHMGAMPIIGQLSPTNFIHILLNNAAHESVGGQPTVAGGMDFERIATGCGYKAYFCAHDQSSLNKAWQSLKLLDGAIFLEIKIQIGSRANLGRPSSTPQENKSFFMNHANA